MISAFEPLSSSPVEIVGARDHVAKIRAMITVNFLRFKGSLTIFRHECSGFHICAVIGPETGTT